MIHKKVERSILLIYFDIRKYSIFCWNHQIKHCLILKRMIPRIKIIWFGSEVVILQPFLETRSFTICVKSARATYGEYSCP